MEQAGPFMYVHSILHAHSQELAILAECKTFGVTKAVQNLLLSFRLCMGTERCLL